jgi:hypothetical protein
LTIFLFCEKLETFLSKNAIYCEDASNLICCVLSRNVKCDRKMRFQIFFLQKYFCEFVLVIMLDHLIVYVWLSDSNFFEMTNALTRATYQTWRKRLIKLDTSDISSFLIDNTSSNLTKCISSNLIKLDIKSDSCVLSNSDERYLIKLDEDSSNLMKTHQTWRYLIKLDENLSVLSDERFLSDERKCRIELSLLFRIVDRRV